MSSLRFVDVTDEPTFRRIPPCADPRFDHRTCDYWEDADRGSRDARLAWLTPVAPAAPSRRPPPADNPFVPPPPPENPFARSGQSEAIYDPFGAGALAAALDPLAGDDLFATPAWNPFAPAGRAERPRSEGLPRKLALLDRGRGVFGSYAKLLLEDDQPVAYGQFGPLSAYPRALRLRELYPALPRAPLPAVITCLATTSRARARGHGRRLVAAIGDDLAERGFAAIEAYPDLTRPPDETSAGSPGFWLTCGFTLAVDDERFPVLRRELG